MAYYNAKTPQEPDKSRPGSFPRDLMDSGDSFLGGLWEGVWRGGKKSYEQWLAEKKRKRKGYDPRPSNNRFPPNWLQRLR